MDFSSSVPKVQEVRPMMNLLQTLRGRFVTVLSGTSVITSRNGAAIPRIGLRLIGENRGDNFASINATTTRSANDTTGYSMRYEGIIRPPPTTRRASPTNSDGASEGIIGPCRFSGLDAHSSRRHRRRRYREREFVRPSRKPSRFSPAWFALSGPGVKHGAARKKFRDAIYSGTILSMILAVYLTLAISTVVDRKEFHIVMILLLMGLTTFFCHSIIRLFMIARRIDAIRSGRLPGRLRHTGYVVPPEPIPISLTGDEEMSRGEETIQLPIAQPPPAYGNWRSSIRINPNLIRWERRHAGLDCNSTMPAHGERPRPQTENRPPSYISDDGDQYTVDLRRGSIDPQVIDPAESLLHPTERNRGK